jgi:peptidyl-tRNA hydrolase, PTH1 family
MNYLIVGLGNIGATYQLTRHNIGFMIIDKLAESQKVGFSTEKLAIKSEFKYKGHQIHLIKPTTYMNLSGKSVNYWLSILKIPIENLLVICDDLNLPFGTIRMRAKGSSGGQNGLNNINEAIATENYARLRFGIGNDYPKGKQVEYVLSRFSNEQMDELPLTMDKATEAIISFCVEGIGLAMTKFNK